MAKRSVRRERQRAEEQRHAKPRVDSAATSPAIGRGAWFGALCATAALVPLAIVAVLMAGSDDGNAGGARPSAAGVDGYQQDVQDLLRQSARRDKEQIQELTERARSMVEDFEPVLVGLGKALPPGQKRVGPLAGAAAVQDWRRRVRSADRYFEETVSGETATNVARGGLSSAVDVLVEVLETYELARTSPSARAELLEHARRQRDLAARTWSTAATQLDAINIAAGYGHQHVTFPSSAGSSSVPPDTLPEGTDAVPPG